MYNDYINHVSWDEVGDYLNAIASRVNRNDFVGVYGIPRGGSVLSAWLSHKLYLPMLPTVRPNCIIVDDICDSGDTMHSVLEVAGLLEDQSCYLTVMYNNSVDNAVKLDYFYREKGDNWIAFPWEQ